MGRVLVVVTLAAALGAGPAMSTDAAATAVGLDGAAQSVLSVGAPSTVQQVGAVQDVTTTSKVVPRDGSVLVVDRVAESRRRWITAGTLAAVGTLGAVGLGMLLAARRARARAAREEDGLAWLYTATTPTAGGRLPADAASGARAEDDFWWTGRTGSGVASTSRPVVSPGRLIPDGDAPGRGTPMLPVVAAPAGPVDSRTVRLMPEDAQQQPGRRAR